MEDLQSDYQQLISRIDAAIAQTQAMIDAQPEVPAAIVITMRAGKGYSWMAKQLNKQLAELEGFTKLTGKLLKQRMGGIMLYRGVTYTFPTADVLGGGPLSGGQSDAHRKKARKAAVWWKKTGKAKWKAQKQEEEIQRMIKEQAAARAAYMASLQTGQTMEDPKVLEKAHLEDERQAQDAHLKTLQGQTLEDPEVIAHDLQQDRARATEAKKKQLIARLQQLHKRAGQIRSMANSSAAYYRTADRPDSESTNRIIKKLEATSAGAESFKSDVMASLVSLSNGKGWRDDLTVEELQELVNKHRSTEFNLEDDLSLKTELAKPNTSIGGAFKYAATATGVATTAAVNGAVSEIPIIGESYERAVGGDIKKNLARDATGVLDRDMAEHAVNSGDVIGRVAATIPQLVNPTAAAVVADSVLHGTVEAVTGEDLATGNELSDGERAFGVVAALASGTGALAKVDSTTKVSKAAAVASGTAAVPTAMSQIANGTGTAKKIAEVADHTTAAITGRKLFKPETELSGTERALSGVSAVAGVAGVGADNTKLGRKHTTLGTMSDAQKTAKVMKDTTRYAKVGDQAVGATTGYSPLRERELTTTERIKDVGSAVGTAGKDLKTAIDGLESDIGDAVSDAFSEEDDQ